MKLSLMDNSVPPNLSTKPQPKYPNTIFIAGGIIILLLATTTAYLLGKESNKSIPNTTVQPTSAVTQIPDTQTQLPLTTTAPTISSPQSNVIKSGWKLYNDDKYLFSFQHPNFDSSCCALAGPLDGKAEMSVILADKNTVVPNTDKPFNGIGIYVEPNNENKSFVDYITEQKKSLLDNYKLMTDKDNTANAVEHTVTVDGRNGIGLIGYSWWAEMIYVPFPDNKKVLIIVKKEETKDSFDNQFKEILSTFKFLDGGQPAM